MVGQKILFKFTLINYHSVHLQLKNNLSKLDESNVKNRSKINESKNKVIVVILKLHKAIVINLYNIFDDANNSMRIAKNSQEIQEIKRNYLKCWNCFDFTMILQ